MENTAERLKEGDGMKTNIVLIGISGVGKTTIGMAIADCLKKEFYDTDVEIEKNSGMHIKEIFQQYGEQYFRKLECEVVKELAQYDNSVIATGGGVVLKIENIKALKDKGIIVNLQAEVEDILERVKANRDRPLYQEGELQERIENLMKEREALYKCADIYINTSQRDKDDIVSEIISQLNVL